MDSVFILLILALIAVFICEHLVGSRWPRWYIAAGIPIYRASQSTQSRDVSLPTVATLGTDRQLAASATLLPVEFRQISSDFLAFRARLTLTNLFLPHVALMRGLIQVDRDAKVVTVTGFLNYWYAMLIVVVTYIIRASDFVVPAIAGMSVGIALSYVIQSGQYRRIMGLMASTD